MKWSRPIIISASVIALVCLLVVLFVYLRKGKKSSEKNITETTEVKLLETPPSLKTTYKINFSVNNSSTSNEIYTLVDRKSPKIKLDMSTGKLIIELLTIPRSIISAQIAPTVEASEAIERDAIEDRVDNIQEGCSCPTLEVSERKQSDGKIPNSNTVKEVMRVVTPSISFQKTNTIEIRQDIRSIDVFLNGELFHSAMLDYVPYLYPDSAVLLPDEAWRNITINKLEFKDSVEDF